MRAIGLLGVVLLVLGGCALKPAIPIDDEDILPFVVERDLAGMTIGKGEFSAINGTERSFTAYLDGTVEGDTLILVEEFVYDDGETDTKTWRLTKLANGEYVGTREDVIGTARGYMDGDAFRLEYKVRLPGEDGGKGMTVRFKDVLVKRQDGVIVNTATVGKFGFRVGKVTLTIARVGPAAAQ